jgi:hypothetical protein
VPDLIAGNPEAVAGFWGVVIGATLALLGQVISEVARWSLAARDRRNSDRDRRRDFRLSALLMLQGQAESLREVYLEYAASGVPSPALERRLNGAEAAFTTRLWQVEDDGVRNAFISWREAARAWANEEGQNSKEAVMWSAAAQACGRSIMKES